MKGRSENQLENCAHFDWRPRPIVSLGRDGLHELKRIFRRFFREDDFSACLRQKTVSRNGVKSSEKPQKTSLFVSSFRDFEFKSKPFPPLCPLFRGPALRNSFEGRKMKNRAIPDNTKKPFQYWISRKGFGSEKWGGNYCFFFHSPFCIRYSPALARSAWRSAARAPITSRV